MPYLLRKSKLQLQNFSMTKFYFLAVFSLFAIFNLKAQTHSLGFRTGSGQVSGAEVSYQYKLNDINRIQLDLGLRSRKGVDAFKVSGLYQWVQDLPQLEKGFNWHYGFGAGLGFISFDQGLFPSENYGTTLFSLDGMVGLEYSFKELADIPLQAGIDLKPSLQFFNGYFDLIGVDLALSLRWQF